MENVKKYQSFNELKEAVINGVLVNWQNALYYVKIDFEGDFVIKCTNTPMQELLADSHDINDFFTVENKTTAEKYARKDSITGKGINDGFCFGDGDFYCASSLDALSKCEELGFETMEEAYKEEAYYWTGWEIEEGENYFDEQGNEYDFEGKLTNDLFENPENLPDEVKAILDCFQESGDSYDNCTKLIEKLEKVGYTCDYYLDAEPYNLRKI